jgi:hypothetical protein
MDSIYSTLFGIMMGASNRGEEVGRDTVGEYTIDTCYTIDQGWETAVWKNDHPMIIVGRYASKEDAQQGHKDWCEVCKLEPNSAWSVQTERIESFGEE